MKESPILFSADMVRAQRRGIKTQTRRIVTGMALKFLDDGFTPEYVAMPENHLCKYGYAGDRLWVRETFYIDLIPYDRGRLPKERPEELTDDFIFYRADGECCDQIAECDHTDGPANWRPAIHIPRWVSRTTLKILELRVQRLHDITEEDADAEGVICCSFPYDVAACGCRREQYKHLWDTLNAKRHDGKYAWHKNPWVWAISFKEHWRAK